MAAVLGKEQIKKIGLILQGTTPKLLVVYQHREGKYRRRRMPIRGMYRNSDLKIISAELRKKHPILSELESLQLEKLLSIIQETIRGNPVSEAIAFATKNYTLDPNENLNGLDDKVLEVKKKIMDSSFEKNCIKPDNPNFKYDVEVNFDTFETSAGWDSDSDEIADF